MKQVETHLIIGAGHAGGRAAATMREVGFEGRVVMIGTEPSLPYERPPLSKDFLHGKAVSETLLINPASYYGEHGIEVQTRTTAVAIRPAERVVELEDGGAIAYDRLLITTGARPRRLTVAGADALGVHYLRTLQDAANISAHLIWGGHIVIVGGGLIGLEVAAAAKQRGMHVAVIEMTRHVMGRVLPADIAALVAEQHRVRGVAIHTDCAVHGICRLKTGKLCVSTAVGDLLSDLVVVGIGAEPNVALAETAQLVLDNGIVVNEFCEASIPGVYAAGDVACFHSSLAGRRVRLESWHNAQSHAEVAARSMCGQRVPYSPVPYNWSQQFDMNIQITGLIDRSETMFRRGPDADGGFLSLYSDGRRLVGAVAVNRPRDLRVAQHLIEKQTDIAGLNLADEGVSLKALLRAVAE